MHVKHHDYLLHVRFSALMHVALYPGLLPVGDLGGGGVSGVATPPLVFFFSDYKLFCYFPQTFSS